MSQQGDIVKEARRATPELQALANLFYKDLDELGQFEEVAAADMPADFQKLLDHDEHMTVTVEAHHGCPVDVSVVDIHKTPTHYSRKILLARR